MEKALLFGLTASSALVAGSLIGARWKVPKKVLATLLAFAGGALIAALSYELFGESFDKGGAVRAGVGLLAGAGVFILFDTYALKRFRSIATGLALVAAVTLDGIPENIALGTTLAGEGGSLALLVAIFASNFPEALAGAADMKRSHESPWLINGIWLAAAILLAAAVVVGSEALEGVSPGTLSLVLAFAGGAVLASLADTVLPEAYADGGPLIAFSTVAGFFISFMLNTL